MITFATHSILNGGRTRLYATGFFYALSLLSICGSVPPCRALMRRLPLRWNATGKAEPLFFSDQQIILSVMHSTERNCLNANNSSVPTTSAHETCKQFIAFIKAQYPQLYAVKYKRYKNYGKEVFCFRARYRCRYLYSVGYTAEFAMSKFMWEIFRKCFYEKIYDKDVFKEICRINGFARVISEDFYVRLSECAPKFFSGTSNTIINFSEGK